MLLEAHKKINLIFIGQRQKQFCKKHTWIQTNHWLVAGNIIPQCQKCNRGDRNRWVYDEKGRVIKLADANFVRNFDKEVKEKIYKILHNEFNGKNPNSEK